MTPKDASTFAREICGLAPVIPVLVVTEPEHAVPLAKALVAGGLPVLEVTLRTPAALEVIRAMAGVEGGVVGAGTLLTPEDVRNAKAAGARFGVSPGITEALVEACEAEDLPLLGGTATVSEAMRMLERGYDVAEVLPGRGERRREVAEGLRGAAAADELLPDRRRHALERARLPRAAERALRRRLLGGGGEAAQRGQVGRGRAARPRGKPAEGVAR